MPKKFSNQRNFVPLIISLIFIGSLFLITSIIKNLGYHITYSKTPSMPKGFYLVTPIKKINRLDIVEFTPPKDTLDFAQKKKWIPKSGLIIKYVFALPNDHVCTKNESLFINGKKTGKIYKYYDKNKILPQTKFCGKLRDNQYLLLSNISERSFDGRYFGAISLKNIKGHAIPIFIY